MMKHLFSFLIIASLLLFDCRSKTQSNFQPELSEQAEESYSLPEEYAEEVIVTGKVLNRDFYPNEKDLTLIIPFFRKMENQYCAPIQKDGSFSFRFPIFAKIREISIRNYAEHLYVHPGDSVYVEIDFKDINDNQKHYLSIILESLKSISYTYGVKIPMNEALYIYDYINEFLNDSDIAV